MSIKNAADIWEIACNTLVGTDEYGEMVSTLTRFGTAVLFQGIETHAYQIGHNAGVHTLSTAQQEARDAVVAFLREFADAIEQGK